MNHTLIKMLQKEYPGVTVVMASKYLTAEQFEPFIKAGIDNYGENRVDAFLEKKGSIDAPLTWHFIGTLQSKKVKKVINEIDCLHTLDRESLVDEISKYRTTPLPCFIQCNISKEPAKHGVTESTINPLLEKLKSAPMIQVIGVMGMAEDTDDEAIIMTQFNTLKNYLTITQTVFPSATALSMGMSQDYPLALTLGATHIRLGRVLLEEINAI